MKTKTRKSRSTRSVRGLPVKTVAARTAKGVKGGFTSSEHTSLGGTKGGGSDKLKYLEVKMEGVIIS